MNDLPASDQCTDGEAADRQVRITTGSRLHFGLLDTCEPFGGLGLMVDQPCTEVVVSANPQFEGDPRAKERLSEIALRVSKHGGLEGLPPCRVSIKRCVKAHCGLGSGTQLSLAAAEAMCRFLGLSFDPMTLACDIAGRGLRSAVGVHGYFSGGMIFEGAVQPSRLNPVRERIEIPTSWCVAIYRPRPQTQSVSGQLEQDQFARLQRADQDRRNRLVERLTSQILPAAERGDFDEFTNAVQQYNQASGMLFAEVQGGAYNGPEVTRLIQWLTETGARGVGQSSWGPGVFAWFESESQAKDFADHLPSEIEVVATTHCRNRSRELTINHEPHHHRLDLPPLGSDG